MQKETGVSNKTVADFRCFIRQLSMTIAARYPILGGPGTVMQVDETALHTKKFEKGCKDTEVQWVFGGIVSGTREAFAVLVEDRKTATLMKIMKEKVHPDTIIHSDCFASYTQLNSHFAGHMTVNHTTNFVNPINGVHTNSIESFWSRLKRPFKLSHGIPNNECEMVIAEVIVREREGDQFMKKIFQEIKNYRC
uniref:DDE_Tnp_IS1595 domain-containing protein n=2 Tax=Caenorhabditis japonica TaxID=281687 RepID=A0A8R1E480_CAEJA